MQMISETRPNTYQSYMAYATHNACAVTDAPWALKHTRDTTVVQLISKPHVCPRFRRLGKDCAFRAPGEMVSKVLWFGRM